MGSEPPRTTHTFWMRVCSGDWWERVILTEFSDEAWRENFRMCSRSFKQRCNCTVSQNCKNLYFPNVPWAKHVPRNATFRKRSNSDNYNCRNNSVNVTLWKTFTLIKGAKILQVCKLQKGRDKGFIFKLHNATQLFSIPNNPLLTFLTFSLMDTGHSNWMGSLCNWGQKNASAVQRPVWASWGESATWPTSTMPVPFPLPCRSLCKPFCSSSIR